MCDALVARNSAKLYDGAAPGISIKTLIDVLPMSVCIVDELGHIVETNAAWESFAQAEGGDPLHLGVGSDYLAVCDVAAAQGIEVSRVVAEAIRRLISEPDAAPLTEFEYPCHSPTEQRWFICRVSRIDKGVPARVLVMHEDISVIKELESAILDREERFRAAFEQAAAGIVHTDLEGRLLRANRAYVELLGYTQRELAAMAPAVNGITYEADRQADAELRQRLYSGEITEYYSEKRYVKKSGDIRWVGVTASLIRSQQQGTAYVQAVVKDIHHEKVVSLALAELTQGHRGRTLYEMGANLLRRHLRADMVFVGEFCANRGPWISLRAVSTVADSSFGSDVHLKNAPCSLEVGGETTVILDRLQEHFPDNPFLQELDAQAYVGTPLWGQDGSPLGCIAALWSRPVQDSSTAKNLLGLVAPRLAAEIEAELESDRFRALFDSSPSAVFQLEADGTIAFTSESTETILGYAPGTLTGRPLLALIADKDRERAASHYMGLLPSRWLSGSSPKPLEVHVLRSDEVVVECSLRVVLIGAPGRESLVAHVEDISQRKALEQAQNTSRRELEERVKERTADLERVMEKLDQQAGELEAVLHHMVDAVVRIDGRGVMQAVNPATWRLFGYTEAELVGNNVSMLMHEPVRSSHDRYLADYQRTGHAAIIGNGRDVLGKRKDGSTLYLELTVSEHLINGERQFTGILRDVHERKQLMDRLRESAHTAEIANRAKSDFLATMSHELRTPLNGVVSMAALLTKTTSSDEQTDLCQIIDESAHHLLEIIDEVLDFLKAEEGKLQIEIDDLNAGDVVRSVCNTMEAQAWAKGVELTLFIEPGAPLLCRGDAARLRQVLLNLIGNAIKFSSGSDRRGKVHVSVTASAGAPWGNSLQIAVTDNGIGIPEDMVPHLFKPFTQADMSTTRRFGGTGLGLSISKKLIDLMHGSISVASTVGAGTEFLVLLPLATPTLSDHTEPSQDNESLLKGVICPVFVCGILPGLGEDLRAYLAHAGAAAMRVREIAEAPAILRRLMAPRWVAVVDGASSELLPKLRAMSGSNGDGAGRFILVGRGERHLPRQIAVDAIEVNGCNLDSAALIGAVAKLAAGETLPPDGVPHIAPPPRSQPQLFDQHNLAGAAILVAEDNPTNQLVIRKQFAQFGLNPQIVANGSEALACIQRGGYDLVLTDLHMPKMDGYELARSVRQFEATHTVTRTPIVALTANALRDVTDRCAEAGMDGYLTKPVALDQLYATVCKWVARHEVPEPPAERGASAAASTKPVLDLGVLRSMIGEDQDDMDEVLADFWENALDAAERLRAALAQSQVADVGDVAHRLKSSARWVGALRLGDVLEMMEEAASLGQIKDLRDLLVRFEVELAQVEAAFQ